MRHHLELAIAKALPALRALKPTGLATKDIEHVHVIYPTPDFRATNEANLILPGRGNALTAEPQFLL
jgi:hypothetical protein